MTNKGFDDEFKAKLKDGNDIVEVISKYINLKQKGKSFWGCCPFHREKTPSFSINPEGQFYHCFGCGKGGDVIKFVMEYENWDFLTAVKFLAERANLKMPEMSQDALLSITAEKQKKDRLLLLLKDTARFYVNNLRTPAASGHLNYLGQRGFDGALLKKFGIGCSLDFDGLISFLTGKGYTKEEMLESGAADQREGRIYDALGGRIIFPVINILNDVVAFGGRVLGKTDFAKYKNTKETIVFSKSKTLYNINLVKKLKQSEGLNGIIIVEGYMDTISLYKAGFYNVCASMGTSLTKDQAKIIKRLTDNVFISYDADAAGQNATLRGLGILKDEGLNVKVINLKDGLDPDDLINKFGRGAYEDCIKKAMPLIDYRLFALSKNYDLSKVEEKRKYTAESVKIIKTAESAAEQEDLLKKLKENTGYTTEALKKDLENVNVAQNNQIIAKTGIKENKDAITIASRFILYSAIFDKSYAKDFDLSGLAFGNELFDSLKEVITEYKKAGRKLHPSTLLNSDFDDEEIMKILIYSTESKMDGMTEISFFEDCVKKIKNQNLSDEINKLTEMINNESDAAKRRELMALLEDKLKRGN